MSLDRLTLPRGMFAVLACAALVTGAAGAQAQTAFPAPLPGQPAPASSLSPFPPVNAATGAPMQPMQPVNAPAAFPSGGAAPMGQSFSPTPGAPQAQTGGGTGPDCMKEFLPLRQEVEKRGGYLQALGKRKGTPSEACKGFESFSQAEVKMIKYVEANGRRCGIPASVTQQMVGNHKRTEEMQSKVCAMAQQQAQGGGGGGPAMSLSEALGATPELPSAKPTKRNGGSTFDTLSGNVLAR